MFATPALRRLARSSTGLVHRLQAALHLRRQRRSLRALDAHLLRDIGLTAAEAEAEAARPVWDVTPHWRQR
jgi:uncharacterized protein YjiS (DUF1127 family)